MPVNKREVPRAPGERGGTLIEFALVLTVLFMFMFGIIDLSRALYAYHFVGDAAREGVRFAMVRGSSCKSYPSACPASAADVQNSVKNVPEGIDPTAVTVTTTWTPNNNPGSVVNVKVQYSFKFILPFLPKSVLTMTSASQSVISQ
ncbi:MAG: TadE/TadG family type IV pilus assembly protein [Candidatus Acidiferrales bacterium]